MPLLRDVLAQLAFERRTVRVHIRSGLPRYWSPRQQIRKIRGSIRYKNGTEAFRSKSVTGEALSMHVTRTVSRNAKRGVDIVIFEPYGRRGRRSRADAYEDPEGPRGAHGKDGPEDHDYDPYAELPF